MGRAGASILTAVLLATMAAAQPLVYDSFDGGTLDGRWHVDSSAGNTAAIDPQRRVLVFEGMENQFNHVETPLPTGADYVQVDICNISDVSASWSPSLILYWDESNWVRLMVSLMYQLRVQYAVAGERTNRPGGLRIMPGAWYRCAMKLEADTVRVMCSEVGDELREVATLPRNGSWAGQPLIILGKGYMFPVGGNPDFDNNYYKSARRTRVACDDFIIGDPSALTDRIAASMARHAIGGRHDPSRLQVAFWPNVTRSDTRNTLWLAPGIYQRLSLLYSNFDTEHAAQDFRLELEVPDGLGLDRITYGDYALEMTRTPVEGGTRYELRPEGGIGLPPDLGGVDFETKQPPGWFSWPRNARTPDLAIFCEPDPTADGVVVRARAKAASGAGPWTEMTVRMVEPLPPLIEGPPEHLGLSMWGGDMTPHVDNEAEILDRLMAAWARLGVRRIHTHGRAPVVAAAKAHGIAPFLSSWWHYSTQCPPQYVPTDEKRASEPQGRGSGFCPQVIAEGAGTYGRFLDDLTAKMAASGCVGFMLDYECAMPLCYDDRCRRAFIEFSGHDDVNWPGDVKKEGRYWREWIDFRCQQGAWYCRAIRDAARRAAPDCPMQAWVAGYDYNQTITRATIDVSRAAEFLTEPEIPHYTLPADYSDMWTADAGIGSVEAGIQTVEDTLRHVNKPIIFCSSIIYPCGSTTRWSDPQILDVQIQTIIAAGARGVSFWGGHFHGGADGRFMHKLVKWHNLLAAAGDFLWHGERDDGLARLSDDDTKLLRRFVWTSGDRRLLVMTNLSQEDRSLTAAVDGCGRQARELLSSAAVDLARPVTVPALDGVWLTLSAK
ncbi:MAG: hypothetical protein J7M38_08265 [Armatimonadetes bacterium]|nr:hypothetical protein [Armatimonadota bacterium]